MKTPSIEELQKKLQELRGYFLDARPRLAPETRPFKYQKPLLNSQGTTTGWEWVTEQVTVTLRMFGIPACEARCVELGKEIREVKDKIKELGHKPVEHVGSEGTITKLRREKCNVKK